MTWKINGEVKARTFSHSKLLRIQKTHWAESFSLVYNYLNTDFSCIY